MARITSILIWVVGLVGLYGTFGLVNEEWTKGNICPKILGIPACFIILACILLVLIEHSSIFKRRSWVYFLGAGIAFTIASYGSLGEIFGFVQCPKTSAGTPMCFLSFGLFSTLLILKFLQNRLNLFHSS